MADTTTPKKKIVIAAPRGWCAGVDRAVEIVEKALQKHGSPVYVRKQIVHNLHVVRSLEGKGAVFVDSEEEIPEGSVCVLSAHGSAPTVYANADARNLKLIDATCPLVTKVHVEAQRFSRQGKTIVLIGHEGHEEVEGTFGQAPDRTVVVEDAEAASKLELDDPGNVAFVSQTTLSVDEAMSVVGALRKRFPLITGPTKDDICYASQNRQTAVRKIASLADLVLVVGSKNSSNSNRLVEVARESGTESYLVENETGIDPAWIERAGTIGISSGASTPEVLVDRVIDHLASQGVVDLEEVRVATEDIRFPLPASVS
ncbi:MAG TPA: 4-hydroxy-3-methylbut-2-enyl diphosphate reductase [Actinomycetota bacterium]|nr:4-hydroxy-3-methylbut-2-enyl diphosphate reductase [Actinomycetota bacterium]